MTLTTLDQTSPQPAPAQAGAQDKAPSQAAAPSDQQAGTASALRALHLLEVFTTAHPILGVSEIGRRAGMPTSTTHRLLSHLVTGGFVTKDGSGYRLSHRLFELGNRVSLSQPKGLKDLAAPYLGELFGAKHLNVHLAVLDGPEIIMVDKVVGLSTHPSLATLGGRYPSVCTALGKAMLPYEPNIHAIIASGMPRRTRHSITDPSVLMQQLSHTRKTRIAYGREEATLGQVCVASPILVDGRAVGAISLSGSAKTLDPAAHGPALIRATTLLAQQLS